jgi:hypothetical protein
MVLVTAGPMKLPLDGDESNNGVVNGGTKNSSGFST